MISPGHVKLGLYSNSNNSMPLARRRYKPGSSGYPNAL
jgi:hypothetical protein